MCSHFLFELEGAQHNVFAIEESQQAVYLATNAAPIYLGPHFTDVNMEWVLHCLNFFRHHMATEDVGTLFESVNALPVTQKPSAWHAPLQQGAYPLGKHWKGTYSFLEAGEITKIRSLKPDQIGSEFFSDKNVDEGKVQVYLSPLCALFRIHDIRTPTNTIQSLELDFVQKDDQIRWPASFEDRLHSLRNTMVARGFVTQGRSKPKVKTTSEELQSSNNIQFVGKGEDLEDDFNAIGWLNALPPQSGIPGWQRITFMKHFMEDFDSVDQDNLWAYEGVVLPGGRIILGRWWFASVEVSFDVRIL